MNLWTRAFTVVAGASILGAAAWGQSVISARSGIIHYLEGQVFLEEKPVAAKFGQFPDIKEGNVFRTGDGRAEILLTPGVFLRVGENSSVRMVANKLTNTRVEIITGSALVECAEVMKDNMVTFMFRDKTISLLKKGLFRIDTDPATLRVYDGEALVQSAGVTATVKDGRMLPLNDAVLVSSKFNKEDGDSLYRWAKRRAGALAVANLSAARQVQQQGNGFYNSGSYGGMYGMSGWQYNPYFGMFTYLPYRGVYNSPFGYRFWSPYTIQQVYEHPSYTWNNNTGGGAVNAMNPSPHYNSDLGYTVAGRSMGESRSTSMPSAVSESSASPAASSGASSARGGESSAPRGGSSSGGHR
jgi:hypothetical protein